MVGKKKDPPVRGRMFWSIFRILKIADFRPISTSIKTLDIRLKSRSIQSFKRKKNPFQPLGVHSTGWQAVGRVAAGKGSSPSRVTALHNLKTRVWWVTQYHRPQFLTSLPPKKLWENWKTQILNQAISGGGKLQEPAFLHKECMKVGLSSHGHHQTQM